MSFETRELKELREISDNGEFSGYIAVWGTVDSYNSTFVRGCFKKTIKERADTVKVLYNHDTLIGKATQIREDDFGCFVSGIIDLETQAGRETHSMLKKGILDGLSFGFTVDKRATVSGVDTIQEVNLYEFGPVNFPANNAAKVMSVRSDDYQENKQENTFLFLLGMFQLTIWGCMENAEYDRTNPPEMYLQKISDALNVFGSDLMVWANGYFSADNQNGIMAEIGEMQTMSADIAKEIRSLIGDKTPEEFALNSEFTIAEVRDMLRGKPICRGISANGEHGALNMAHKNAHKCRIENIIADLRQNPGIVQEMRADIMQILNVKSLEKRESGGKKEDYSQAISYLREVRKGL